MCVLVSVDVCVRACVCVVWLLVIWIVIIIVLVVSCLWWMNWTFQLTCVCRLASCDLNCCNHCCCSSMLVEDELNMGVAYIWILYDVPSSVLCVVSWTTNTDFHVRLELFCLTMIIMTFGCWLDIKTAKISGFQGMHHNLLIRPSFLLLLLLFFFLSFSVIHSWCLVLYKIFVYVYYSWMDATVFPCRSFCGPTCIPNKRGFKQDDFSLLFCFVCVSIRFIWLLQVCVCARAYLCVCVCVCVASFFFPEEVRRWYLVYLVDDLFLCFFTDLSATWHDECLDSEKEDPQSNVPTVWQPTGVKST